MSSVWDGSSLASLLAPRPPGSLSKPNKYTKTLLKQCLSSIFSINHQKLQNSSTISIKTHQISSVGTKLCQWCSRGCKQCLFIGTQLSRRTNRTGWLSAGDKRPPAARPREALTMDGRRQRECCLRQRRWICWRTFRRA